MHENKAIIVFYYRECWYITNIKSNIVVFEHIIIDWQLVQKLQACTEENNIITAYKGIYIPIGIKESFSIDKMCGNREITSSLL